MSILEGKIVWEVWGIYLEDLFLRCKMQLKCKQVGWNGYLFDEYLLR